MQGSKHRLYRLLGWPDTATATIAVAFYSLMSIAFGVLATVTVRAVGAELGPLRVALFAVALLAHVVLHWFALRLLTDEARRWTKRLAYGAIQAALIFAISLLVTDSTLALGLWVTLLAETVAVLWPEWQAMILAAVFCLSMMALNTTLAPGLQELAFGLPTTGLLLGAVVIYALVFAREARGRQQAQELVRQLEITKRQLQDYAQQVQELTISHERQRMAREMHDTLAQGLAGVIMQLEAADSHLEGKRSAEAQVIVQQAMQRARQTLHEARRAIQALRSTALEEKELAVALAGEVSQFEVASGVVADFVLEGEPGPIAPHVAQHILRIVQASLSNVGRHAEARHVQVRFVQSGPELELVVQDDGKGFDVEAAKLRSECFGLQGMYERAQRLGATLKVESAPRQGTTLVLSLNREGVPKPGLNTGQASGMGAVVGAQVDEEMSQ